MKAKLIEVDFTFQLPARNPGDVHQFHIHVGRLNGKTNLTFTLSGADEHENLPAALAGAIQEGLAYAQKHVVERDLRDPDAQDGNG